MAIQKGEGTAVVVVYVALCIHRLIENSSLEGTSEVIASSLLLREET